MNLVQAPKAIASLVMRDDTFRVPLEAGDSVNETQLAVVAEAPIAARAQTEESRYTEYSCQEFTPYDLAPLILWS